MAVRHSNPVSQAGFTMIPNAVMLRGDLSCGAKVVYGYLKHLAWRNSSDEAATTREVIQSDLGIGKNQVTAYIQELAREPALAGDQSADSTRLIEAHRQGRGLPNVYLVNDPVIPQMRESRSPESGSLESPNEGFLPSLTQESKSKKRTTPSVIPPIGDSLIKGRLKPKSAAVVGKKPVTVDEASFAASVLIDWNELTDQSLTATEWTSMIIRRHREHQALALDDFRALMKANLDDPWWKGPPNPSVIFGNAAQFERSMIKATNATKNGSLGAIELGLAELAKMREES